MTCRGGSSGGAGWKGEPLCSRNAHAQKVLVRRAHVRSPPSIPPRGEWGREKKIRAVVGGRAQVKLPRHLVLGMRIKKRRGRLTRAVGIALAVKHERVTGLRSVIAKKVFGGCVRQKLPSHPDLRMGVKKRWWLRDAEGRCGECVSTLYLCRMEGKMTVPLCVSVPGLCWGLDR
jgi:hypothetical protein